MSSFKPMVKMFTDEPKAILKLKKGGKVHSKHHKEHEEHGHKTMHHAHGGMHHAFESEAGHSPKKPSHAARHKAMNPNLYAKGGKVAHKGMGGMMPPSAPQGMPAGAPMGGAPMGQPPMGQPMRPMGQSALGQMTPAQRAARAMMVRKALTGMKKGGSTHAECAKLEKELHHHEALDMAHAHHKKHGGKMHHKASGGAIDKYETKTTIEGNAKKFEKTKVVDGEHHDKHHGTGYIKEGKPAGFKHGGRSHKMHHKATGGQIPADTHEKKNKGKFVHDAIEGNEHDYLETEMHSAKKDKAHGTGGIHETNAGGFKHGGKAHHKVHHKAHGGKVPGMGNAIEHSGDWENRPADTAHGGVKNRKTGEVKEANAGGFKHGGHASKKAYATGGNVVNDGKPVAMPKKHVSQPVANSLQSGTFKRGGKVHHHHDGDSVEKDPTPSNSSDMRRKPAESNYSEQAVNKSIASSNRSGRKISGKEAKAIHSLLKGRH